MKLIQFIVTSTLIIGTNLSTAYANSNQSLWLYGGFQMGVSQLTSEVVNEAGDKQGLQWGLQTSMVYKVSNDWSLNSTLSWFNLDYESEFVNGQKFKIETRSFALDISPLWRPHHRWSIGPKVQLVLAEEILLGPTPFQNVDSDLTTDKIVGFNAFYEIPTSQYKIRTGFHGHYLLDTNERDAYVLLFSLEFGGQILNNAKEVKVTKKSFVQKPSKKIKLEGELISFETGTAELNESSREFLNELGSVLRDYLNDWEVLKLEGHTDARGSAKSNMKLSLLRVESVKAALVEGGAPEVRIKALSFGETKLITEGTTAEDHAINRRVEMKFIGRTRISTVATIFSELKDEFAADLEEAELEE